MIDVVCAVITRHGRLLCMRRLDKGSPSTAGRYELPGGKIERGETPFDAIRREIREELEWDVTPLEVMGSIVHSYPDFTLRLTAIRCTAPAGGEPALHAHSDYRWVEPARLRDLPWADADWALFDAIGL